MDSLGDIHAEPADGHSTGTNSPGQFSFHLHRSLSSIASANSRQSVVKAHEQAPSDQNSLVLISIDQKVLSEVLNEMMLDRLEHEMSLM